MADLEKRRKQRAGRRGQRRPRLNQLIEGSGLDHTIPTPPRTRSLRRHVLKRLKHEERTIRQYVEVQARGERVTHLEKIATERIGTRRRDAWDVHTGRDRYWVITSPTNLYSQKDFPSLDYTMSFHVGVTTRVAALQSPPTDDSQQHRFAAAWRRWTQAAEALDQADEVEDFQAVGMRCRECLLELVRAVADPRMVPEGTTPPKRADFVGWTELIANAVTQGPSAERARHYLKTTAEATWALVNWLTHTGNAMWLDGQMAVDATANVLNTYGLSIMRRERDAPSQCPQCSSYRLSFDFQPRREPPYVTVCNSCGWTEHQRRRTTPNRG
ncbi:MAG: hypothetical protein ACREJ6_09485 [Candidatus Methylomirabilis sp.]